jgi:hypothetical protein
MSADQCGRELGRYIEPHTAAAVFTQETPSSLHDQNTQKEAIQKYGLASQL